MPEIVKTQQDKNLFSRFMLAVAIFEPLTTIPQIYEVWQRDASGVSLITWVFYATTALLWLIYGIKIKDKPITVSSACWVLTEGMVVAGLLVK